MGLKIVIRQVLLYFFFLGMNKKPLLLIKYKIRFLFTVFSLFTPFLGIQSLYKEDLFRFVVPLLQS